MRNKDVQIIILAKDQDIQGEGFELRFLKNGVFYRGESTDWAWIDWIKEKHQKNEDLYRIDNPSFS